MLLWEDCYLAGFARYIIGLKGIKNMWKKIERQQQSDMWDWEKDGSELEGELIEVQDGVGPNNSVIYRMKAIDGAEISFWGNTVLDNRLKDMEVGTKIKIEYLGIATSPKTGRKYKDFSVYQNIEE